LSLELELATWFAKQLNCIAACLFSDGSRHAEWRWDS
jgi:hypothetical protein